jgi:hypothetical protein
MLLSGCSVMPDQTIIAESRYKVQSTGSLYLKTPATYCFKSTSPLFNSHNSFFKNELLKQWDGYATAIQTCDKKSYMINFNKILITNWKDYPELKLDIYDPSGKLLADYSLGTLKNINNERDHEFYHNFITNFLSPKHIFGVSK